MTLLIEHRRCNELYPHPHPQHMNVRVGSGRVQSSGPSALRLFTPDSQVPHDLRGVARLARLLLLRRGALGAPGPLEDAAQLRGSLGATGTRAPAKNNDWADGAGGHNSLHIVLLPYTRDDLSNAGQLGVHSLRSVD